MHFPGVARTGGPVGPPSPLPSIGPVMYAPQGIAGVAIGAGLTLGPITFVWPRPVFVTGLLLLPRTGLIADLAGLGLRIEDETQQQICSDGIGIANAGFFAPALALHGRGFRIWPLQRPVALGDTWLISVQNLTAAPLATTLLFYFEEGRHR